MSNITKTIEHLSLSKTSNDLWDEFNQLKNPNSLMLFTTTNSSVTVRLLGPFVQVLRFYAPFIKYHKFSQSDIEAIADRRPDAIKKALEFFSDKSNFNHAFDKNTHSTLLKYFKQIDTMSTWQKCIMVNAFVKSDPTTVPAIKIMTITRTLCRNIMERTELNPNAILNGLYAQDISITRRGEGIRTRFEVNLLPGSSLSEDQMRYVLSNELIDIPSLITELNRCSSSSYYYRKTTDYRMPPEFTKVLLEERSRIEEERHFENVEEHLNEIPIEAFERRNNMREAIGSLEV